MITRDRAAARAAAGGRRDRAAGGVRRRRPVRRRARRRRASCCRSPSGRSCSPSTFVASPFYLRQAIAAFESVDPTLHRRRAHARRLAAAHVRADRAAARRGRAGRRLGARVRARDRRVRRDDRVRRQRARRDADAHARRSTSSSRRASTSRSRSASCSSCSAPPSCSPTSCSLMAPLELDITVPLRAFELDVRADASARETVALVGPSGAGKTTVLRARRRACTGPARGRIALGDDVWFDSDAQDRPRRPTAARSGSCSRSTRCSRT